MKKKNLQIALIFVIGLILIVDGVYCFIFKEPIIHIMENGRYPFQGIVSNGSFQLILGLGFMVGGIIKFRNRHKIEPKPKWKKRENWTKQI
jgi:hypothetical protein